ncbi:hypothetical protein PPERSA_03400 [Pseudocohnilembus persalinus]|uniref:Galactose oxidase/kelch, beta-propeller n=1 Tax=Pseudocohnilembus persalinus TaxID=266149 RepID=A0A0V0Q7M0_PSEPJ|nr:hypothetical protein PPERSA_03400 [Pseudocohnilembus persalinus]|eukprot:KRW98198.1 hypothetical protein PPERSA_03400 [Pseudocohnilembus persalinus]
MEDQEQFQNIQQENDYYDDDQMNYEQQNDHLDEFNPNNMDQNLEQNQDNYSQQSNQQYDNQIRKWQWATPLIEGVPPCPRGGHSATLSGASIIIFGGHYYAGKQKGYIYLNDTYVLDVNSNRWHKPKISGTPPASRYGHSAILAGSRIIIFGGKGEKGKIFRDLHALDPVTMTWYQGPEGSGSPSQRFGHSANLIGGTKMLIFGGWNSREYFNDLYLLDLEVMAWTQPQSTGPEPTARYGHTSIQVGNNLIIQGGFCFDEDKQLNAGFKQGTVLRSFYLNDLRILDTDKFIWSRLRVSGTPPLPRFQHTSNISGPDIIFFGGWSYNSGERGEKNFVPQQEIDYFIVLNTENMQWEKGRFEGTPPLSRYGHTSSSIGPHILIFGGWEYNRATNEVVVLRDMSANNTQKQI